MKWCLYLSMLVKYHQGYMFHTRSERIKDIYSCPIYIWLSQYSLNRTGLCCLVTFQTHMKPLYEWICKGFLYQTQFPCVNRKRIYLVTRLPGTEWFGRQSSFTAGFYSLLFYILDGVRQRLILGLRKKKDNKATEDGRDPIDDPWYIFKVCLEDHKQRRQGWPNTSKNSNDS